MSLTLGTLRCVESEVRQVRSGSCVESEVRQVRSGSCVVSEVRQVRSGSCVESEVRQVRSGSCVESEVRHEGHSISLRKKGTGFIQRIKGASKGSPIHLATGLQV